MIDQAFDQAAAALWESLQTVPVDDASRVLMFAREIRRRSADGRPLAAACMAYDAAIQSCGNDPDRMSSFCSAEGEDLDALYLRWLELARSLPEGIKS